MLRCYVQDIIVARRRVCEAQTFLPQGSRFTRAEKMERGEVETDPGIPRMDCDRPPKYTLWLFNIAMENHHF